MYRFPNPENNEWIARYNKVIDDVESGKLSFEEKLSKHHILPRSSYPQFSNDKDNFIFLPFKEHIDMHYYMWKADSKWAKELWFGCVYGRKHKLWDLPNGDIEYEQLKKDLSKHKSHHLIQD